MFSTFIAAAIYSNINACQNCENRKKSIHNTGTTKVKTHYTIHGEYKERTGDAAMGADSLKGAIGRNSKVAVLSSSAVASGGFRGPEPALPFGRQTDAVTRGHVK